MSASSLSAAPHFLSGPVGRLEARITLPDNESDPVMIICHPHPLHQGTMNNKVVTMLAKGCVESGWGAVRFNFRGVGQSEGVHDQGRGEQEDALAVVNWVRAERPQAAIGLAGFSFGAGIALSIAEVVEPSRMVVIAPAVTRVEVSGPACDWLLIQGMQDEVVAADAVDAWASTQIPAPQFVQIKTAGHFFHGHLVQLKQVIADFLKAA